MHTLGQIAKILNRSTIYLSGLQTRFVLPTFKGCGYSEPYLRFLETIVNLRTLNIPEETILDLWHSERTLLQLLHADSTGSPTWFLDSCGAKKTMGRRLLLSNFDTGVCLASGTLQLGLEFSEPVKELFTDSEMGVDALKVLGKYLAAYSRMQILITAEIPNLKTAGKLTHRINQTKLCVRTPRS